ncbi:MAG: tRNA (adenosine(37)-N6)-threonylcarbamoyltransferase complex transferase subunit TsaD [Candidatus Diapherotrites archaeon]|uniref:N(6)-L-threonylcarbamoyladenine synthase n=1 Tax=Candidatus Iainarchaeum sp. TaxID=3101447 RepID=A0A8T3YM23_9ARCH|nr:tRNA (adenosine(37)-N6)-threonylcarbamoyltransferase complex transferase subunit TsaD [Candidatus Diapherotrites archaeon]
MEPKMRKNLACLALEGTAHTAGVAVVDGRCGVLADERHSFTSKTGGMVPRELAEHHTARFPALLEAALAKSGKGFGEIDCIAYSAGPGIGNALSVTATAARILALLRGLPIVPVNHAVAHIEIAKKLCGAKDPLVLYVSGGNTQVIGYENGRYRVYGETLDIGVGNLLDSFGRSLGMGFPAGPELDRVYFEAVDYIELPYSVKGMDVEFSGLQTAAERKIGKAGNATLAYSMMHNAFAMLTEVTERALAHTGKKELMVTGGVAASKALQKMLAEMCSGRGTKLKMCPREYATDNAVNIAWTGMQMFGAKRAVTADKAFTNQDFRVDAEEVNWL